MSGERRKENRFIVYTDIVGHTKLFARVGAPFRKMRERHDELFNIAVRQYAPGAIVKGTGDGFYAAIEDVEAALNIALMFRSGLAAEQWDAYLPAERRTPDNHIRSRVGVHSGLVTLLGPEGRPNDCDGQARTVSERVMSMAQGNQVLATRQVIDAARGVGAITPSMKAERFGEYKLREIPDTVEIWAVGDEEHAPGIKPAQPPEHRVILFAVIADCAAKSSALGTKFDAMKDTWDTLFSRAAAENGKDTFVKRLPDGSLAAFRNAVEAVRAARDFRRMFKNDCKESGNQLEPILAMDCGLVTFDYANNQAIDVRDQPVNIPAKMCKTGIVARWQLLMSRAVRDDAWANLPEREEFKWVCIGRKEVPGEPEPLEIWEFQDVQTRNETRTVLWIDARTVKQSLANLPEAYGQFEAKLGELVIAARSKRAEEPWYLPHDTGLAAAFKDPIEAVLFARDLKAEAMTQQWERLVPGLKRRGRDDNLLRLSLHLGGLKVTLEDGLLKEFKGPVIDGLRPVIELTRNSQIVLTRELKDAVAAGFQEGEVVWKRVDSETTGSEVYELRPPSRQKVLIYSGIGAVAVALLVIVLYATGVIPSGPSDIVKSRKPGEVPGQIKTAVRELLRSGEPTLAHIVETSVQKLVDRDVELFNAKFTPEKMLEEFAKGWAKIEPVLKNWGDYNSVEIGKSYVNEVDKIRNPADLERFVAGLDDYKRPTQPDPRKGSEWSTFIDSNIDTLKGANQGDSDAAKQLEALRQRVNDLTATAWIKKNQKSIDEESKKIAAEIAPGGKLDSDIKAARAQGNQANAALAAKIREEAQREAAKGRLPFGIIEQLITTRESGSAVIKAIGEKAAAVVEDYATANSGLAIEQKQSALEPLRRGLMGLNTDQASLVLDALNAEHLPTLKDVGTTEQMTAWLAGVDQYRRPTGSDPRTVSEWVGAADALRKAGNSAGALTPALIKLLEDLDAEIKTVDAMLLTRKSAPAVKSASEAIKAKLAKDGTVRKPIEDAIEAKRRERDDQLTNTTRLTSEIEAMLAKSPAGIAAFPVLTDAWRVAQARFQKKKTEAGVDLARLKADIERTVAGMAEIAGAFGPVVVAGDEHPWTRSVAAAVESKRDAAMQTLVESLQASPAPDPAPFSASVKSAAQTHASAVEQAKGLIAAWAAVESALDQAYTLGETPPGGSKSVKALADDAAVHPLMKGATMAEAVKPVSDRVAAMAKLATIRSVEELKSEAVSSRRDTPELVVGVWQRMGDASFGGDAWMDAQQDVFHLLEALASPVSAPRKTQIVEAAKGALPGRWVAYFRTLSDPSAVNRAMSRRADFNVADADVSKLPPAAKFNWRLTLLKDAVRGPDSEEKDAAVRKAVEQFVAEPWGGVESTDAGRNVLEGLKAVLAGKTVIGAGNQAVDADPKQIGPGLAGWKFVGLKGDAFTYEMEPPAGGKFKTGVAPRLDFVRMTVPGADGAPATVFLCTTEASLRLVIEIVDKAAAWGKLRGAFTDNPDRLLPFVWSWPSGREAAITLIDDKDPRSRRRSWIGSGNTAPILNTKSYYPDGFDPGEPTLDCPMQYVTPSAAGFIARLANCRLPSSAECTAALTMEGPAGRTDSGWNLRDRTYVKVATHFRKSSLTGMTGPDTRSYKGSGNENEGYDPDDGVMWFADVTQDVGGASHRFHHLVGNVAELVFEKSNLFDGMRIGALDTVLAVLDAPENKPSVMVYGGSALSGKLEGDGLFKAQPLLGGTKNRMFQYGCSDVGFRLAFSPVLGGGQDLSLAAKVSKVVEDAPYVPPASR